VSKDLVGYHALFGCVQLVGIEPRGAAERQFEPDPLEILDDLDLPFGFYGVRPTLFDPPSRPHGAGRAAGGMGQSERGHVEPNGTCGGSGRLGAAIGRGGTA
jgi:hypothetical protein